MEIKIRLVSKSFFVKKTFSSFIFVFFEWHINIHRLFNAKATFVEEQQ